MARVARQDRRLIEPAIFRQAMTDVFGPRPDFRRAARELGVPKSTLHRLWNGGRTISTKNLERLSQRFGVHDGWLSFGLHGVPMIPVKGHRVLWGVVFPGTPRNEVRATDPDIGGLHLLAKIRETATSLKPAKSDPEGRVFPPLPVGEVIDYALRRLAEERGIELGMLSRRERQKILAAWLEAWAVTLESAGRVPSAGQTQPLVHARGRQARRRKTSPSSERSRESP